ncbi:erythromycin esterase family protein [Streptomyces sp. NPDC087263]|uniref:erythromycin esterase family protein n=1 Tax=Streptomyces sp. NPDC087263 TaxID=3365773 RepID=UPI00382B6123
MKKHRSGTVLALLVCLGAPLLGAPPASAAEAVDHKVVDALERDAYSLRTVEPGGDTTDLRALDRMIGHARVVGVGEATHSSHDFFALKDRVFRHLVEEKGFRTFALEGSWSTGLRLNDYVLYGKGDPRRIMSEEFQSDYSWWNNTEYLELVSWMRAYNIQHPHDPVQFMGDDFGWAGPELYDKVTDYVARAHPELLARFTELYRGLRPTVATGTYMDQYFTKPLAERKDMAARTGEALKLLRQQPSGSGEAAKEAYDWAVQHANAIDQTARGYSFDMEDPAQGAAAMRYRDSVMAEDVAWWERHTGTKVLLSAHNAHVGYESFAPADYPRMQGAFLRDSLGSDYVSVGLTFDQGSFNATGPDGKVQRFTLGPASPGTNEYTLDRVRYRDYVVDLRTTGSPARAWLNRARPTRSIGTDYPDGPYDVALAPSHDILIHLHRVEAARLRDR